MKFVKLAAGLLVMMNAVLLFSCSKDDKPAPGTGNIPEDTTVTLLTKVIHSVKLADTAATPEWTDSIYYNAQHQIVKVDAGGIAEPLIYSFTYNTDGTVASMIVRGNMFYHQDYYLHYKNDRLDSITLVDSLLDDHTIMGSKLVYNAQGKLINVNSNVQEDESEGYYPLYETVYARNSNGVIDSVNSKNSDPLLPSRERSAHLSTVVSPVKSAIKPLGNAYLFMLAVREWFYMFGPNHNNLFLHQFLNPEDNLFNDGYYNWYLSAGNKMDQQYSSTVTYYPDNSLRTYQYYEGAQGAPQEVTGIKFIYTKVRK